VIVDEMELPLYRKALIRLLYGKAQSRKKQEPVDLPEFPVSFPRGLGERAVTSAYLFLLFIKRSYPLPDEEGFLFV
jgi:hypothetical protein